MNYKTFVTALLVLTVVGASVLVWHQRQQIQELRLAALGETERADLLKRIRRLEDENRDLRTKLAAARTSPRAAEGEGELASAPDAENAGPRAFRGRGPQFAALRELMAKPEAQALLSATQKSMLDSRYAALFRKLGLTPDQSSKLSALLLDRQSTMQDVLTAAREQGLDLRNDRDSIRKLVADAQSTVDASIKSLLGDTGYSQLVNYEQTLPQRNVVNALQQQLISSDSPLTSSQVEQLVDILAASASTTADAAADAPPPPRGDFGGPGGGMLFGGGGAGGVVGPSSAAISSAALAQAQTVLSASQLAALQQLQQQQQNARQLQQLIRGAAGSTRGGRGGGG
ncbi:hypothetical protein [Opitutus sp. ER46]|uniref:hypothetical protein n=1 Tax=Opitutus sp. ER46 TaxID=2161864 RepID=UPI000D31FE04|nr:hypothetical protein [Opitutus sp. ER46]PTX91029.1 hypothetical protein DB354_20525 [Opitutus sp. ER46]